MAEERKLKTCFVIAPIGEERTEIRRRSDQVLTHIIKPAASECGYNAIRADEISEPGIITSQVIQHLMDDDLVIADLSDRNPNVFYELAVRHTIKKPMVQIIQAGESIPFDVAPARTIHFDYQDLDSVANCKDEIIKQIRSVEEDPTKVDSPISVAIDLQFLRQSENPLEKSFDMIISMLAELRAVVASLQDFGVSSEVHINVLRSASRALNRVSFALNLPENEEPTRRKFAVARHYVSRAKEIIESSLPAEAEDDIPF